MNIAAFGLASLIGMAAVAPVAAAEPAHPTIRQMAGATPIDALQAGKTAVIVIDFQNEYFPGGRMVIPDGASALQNTRRLIKAADAKGIRVIHVQHVLPAGAPLFAEGGKTVQFHPDMQPRAGDSVVQKDNVSVFAGASAAVMDRTLKDAGIDTLIVTGLMTHACVSGAARDAAAAPRGYRVIVASDATATRDLELATGATIDHKTLHAASLATLEDTYGDVMTTEAIIGLVDNAGAAAR
ncbi:cysteine hydrolase [Stenotrophomonas sp. Betaine-02u-21]|uniref:cysteine hydrolase family protein n=1 Tax=unclassified Stenotrophomonas TaxID=196198 RepID=UPI000C33EDBB|nr:MULTISPECIES: isochorismatase family protein [unclassified Stenotrophomonas]PKH70916.1 cysteine hydrolase [Stenotrophomonas sp. Betaine-02u-23]PKH72732.1 cysteine hydrolase [Stenotrophomonas sp. Betaine-02u-21]PKH97093.1 cysteine hydrolase [Stenotrophomonas sp. Bg11-02]